MIMRWIGLPLALFVTIAAILLGNGRLFVDTLGFYICAIITLGLSISTYGWAMTFRSLSAIRFLFIKTTDPVNENITPVLNSIIVYSYVSGITVWIIGNIQLFRDISDFRNIFLVEAICLVPLFYSLIFSEFFLRPTVYRIKLLINAQKDIQQGVAGYPPQGVGSPER